MFDSIISRFRAYVVTPVVFLGGICYFMIADGLRESFFTHIEAINTKIVEVV